MPSPSVVRPSTTATAGARPANMKFGVEPLWCWRARRPLYGVCEAPAQRSLVLHGRLEGNADLDGRGAEQSRLCANVPTRTLNIGGLLHHIISTISYQAPRHSALDAKMNLFVGAPPAPATHSPNASRNAFGTIQLANNVDTNTHAALSAKATAVVDWLTSLGKAVVERDLGLPTEGGKRVVVDSISAVVMVAVLDEFDKLQKLVRRTNIETVATMMYKFFRNSDIQHLDESMSELQVGDLKVGADVICPACRHTV